MQRLVDMSNASVLNDLIDQKLMSVHTAFIGKVVSVSGTLATVQPLNMVKTVGGEAQKQAVITNCPVLSSAVKLTSFICAETGMKCTSFRSVVSGDVVFCMCADRDISATRTGSFATPLAGHHMLTSAVVVGIL